MTESNGLTSVGELFGKPTQRRFQLLTLPISRFLVRIRSITEREYSKYQAATVSAKGGGLRKERLIDANQRFISLCLVDKDGNRLMTTLEAQNMSGWDAGDTSFLYHQCAEHCGLNRDDIEDLVGNSEETSGDCSPSG